MFAIFCLTFESTGVYFRGDFYHVSWQKIGQGPFKTWKSLSKNWHFNMLKLQTYVTLKENTFIPGVLRRILRSFFRAAI